MAQIEKIESCLGQYPEGSTNENIIKLRQHRDELKNLLNGFQSQTEVLIKKAQEIESFPGTLFEKGSPPDGPGMETSDPRLLMAEAKKISTKFSAALTEIFSTAQSFFASCKSTLDRARIFFHSNKVQSDQLIKNSNSLMDNLTRELEQKISNTPKP